MREDWVECKIGEIFTTITGNTPSKKEIENYESKDIPFVKPPDVTNGILSNVTEFISTKAKNKARLLPVNSVLVTCIGNLGRVSINTNFEVAFNQQINAVIPNSFTLPKFYFYNFQSSLFRNRLEELSTSTTVALVNKSNFDIIDVPLIPLPEQRAIVKKIEALFSSLDAGIADLKKAQDQLKIYRQAVLKKAFEGELTKEWRGYDVINKVPLKEILILSSSKHKAENPEELFYIGLEHIEKDLGILTPNAGIDLISTVKNKFEENNILYGKLRPYLNKVYLSKESGVCSTDILVFKISEKVLGKFIHQFMLSREFVNDMSNNTSGVNLPRVSTKYIENYLVPLPSLNEQSQIVKEIESRLSVCDAVEQQIKDSLTQAEALRQSILKKAFEGKLLTEEEIKACQLEADYEPADVLLEKIKAEKEANKSNKKTKKK